jgi:hypothetical protein
MNILGGEVTLGSQLPTGKEFRLREGQRCVRHLTACLTNETEWGGTARNLRGVNPLYQAY